MILKAEKITKKFGDQTALNHVDLTIENGEFFGLLGPNGAGKTTMIRILSTLMLPTSGQVLADGEVLTRNRTDLKKKITVMTQEYTLRNDMSIAEVLEYQGRLYHVPRNERKERAAQLMDMTGLYHHKEKLIRHLSGGMKKRLSIVCALAKDPEILILDEPGASLDIIAKNDIINYMKKYISQGGTILIASHEEGELSVCNKKYLMCNGVLTEMESHLSISAIMERMGKNNA